MHLESQSNPCGETRKKIKERNPLHSSSGEERNPAIEESNRVVNLRIQSSLQSSVQSINIKINFQSNSSKSSRLFLGFVQISQTNNQVY
ncbi:hypothetical protein OROMI_004186 [Orobanche minor]